MLKFCGLHNIRCARRKRTRGVPREPETSAASLNATEPAPQRLQPKAYDQRRRDSDAAVWRAVLPGLPERQRHRQAGPVRGAQLRRAGAAGARRPQEGGRPPAPSKVNWDLLERRIGADEKAYQRQIIRKKIDELVRVLRTVPAGARPAVDSRAPSSSRATRR